MQLVPISKISATIELHGKQYKLFAVIQFRKEAKHYIAHVNYSNQWRIFDDLNVVLRKEEERYANASILPVVLFYSECLVNN